MKPITLSYKFVHAIPEKLEEQTLYIAMDFATAVHKCCCGCGKEVVTPLSPTDWKLIYDGVSISLSPSVGNWSFECQSHYWIDKNIAKWADQWSKEQIEFGRARDRQAKGMHYAAKKARDTDATTKGKAHGGFWSWLSRLWSR